MLLSYQRLDVLQLPSKERIWWTKWTENVGRKMCACSATTTTLAQSLDFIAAILSASITCIEFFFAIGCSIFLFRPSTRVHSVHKCNESFQFSISSSISALFVFKWRQHGHNFQRYKRIFSAKIQWIENFEFNSFTLRSKKSISSWSFVRKFVAIVTTSADAFAFATTAATIITIKFTATCATSTASAQSAPLDKSNPFQMVSNYHGSDQPAFDEQRCGQSKCCHCHARKWLPKVVFTARCRFIWKLYEQCGNKVCFRSFEWSFPSQFGSFYIERKNSF